MSFHCFNSSQVVYVKSASKRVYIEVSSCYAMHMLMIKLDKLSKKPIFSQVIEQIQRAILDNELPDRYLLPTEKEFSTFYNVSMGSVKHAYDSLEEDGYINRIKGKGSFVLNRPTVKILLGDLKDGRLIQSFDPPLDEKILLMERSRLNESPYPFIQLDLNVDYYKFKTLHMNQHKSIFINELFINSRIFPDVEKFFPFKQSFSNISLFYGQKLTKQRCRFLTAGGDDFRSNLLQLHPKESITQFISVFYTETEEIGIVQIHHFPSTFTNFERVTKYV